MSDEPDGMITGWIHIYAHGESMVDAHFIPVQDIGYHYTSNCPCKPIYDGDMSTWEHNAYDGRGEVRH